MPCALSSVAAPAHRAIASRARIGGSSPRHCRTPRATATRGRPQRQRQCRGAPAAEPREPPAEHPDAQRQDAAPEHGCPEGQQTEQHQQASRLDRRQQRQHQQVQLGVVHRVLHQVRQDAEQDRERDPRQQLRADEPQTMGRRPQRAAPHVPQRQANPAQGIGGEHHRCEQRERRHTEVDRRPVQPLEDVAGVGRVRPPAHGLLQRRPAEPEEHAGHDQAQERQSREAPILHRRLPAPLPREHAREHQAREGERQPADAEQSPPPRLAQRAQRRMGNHDVGQCLTGRRLERDDRRLRRLACATEEPRDQRHRQQRRLESGLERIARVDGGGPRQQLLGGDGADDAHLALAGDAHGFHVDEPQPERAGREDERGARVLPGVGDGLRSACPGDRRAVSGRDGDRDVRCAAARDLGDGVEEGALVPGRCVEGGDDRRLRPQLVDGPGQCLGVPREACPDVALDANGRAGDVGPEPPQDPGRSEQQDTDRSHESGRQHSGRKASGSGGRSAGRHAGGGRILLGLQTSARRAAGCRAGLRAVPLPMPAGGLRYSGGCADLRDACAFLP